MTDRIAKINASLAGEYVLERELGVGGMATVYLAEDVRHRRKVAMKVLRDDLSASVGAARFQRDGRPVAGMVVTGVEAPGSCVGCGRRASRGGAARPV